MAGVGAGAAPDAGDLRGGSWRVVLRVHEVRELASKNRDGTSDPLVSVEVGQITKRTKTKFGAVNAIFEEVLDFEFPRLTAAEVEALGITVSVLDANKLFANSVIGVFRIDASLVYSRPGHGYTRQWVGLVDPSNPRAVGLQGALRLSVWVLGPGDPVPVAPPPPGAGAGGNSAIGPARAAVAPAVDPEAAGAFQKMFGFALDAMPGRHKIKALEAQRSILAQGDAGDLADADGAVGGDDLMVLPPDLPRRTQYLVLTCYRAEGLPDMSGWVQRVFDPLHVFGIPGITPYIQVAFPTGVQPVPETTGVIPRAAGARNLAVVWNQRLRIPFSTPSFSSRIALQVRDRASGGSVVGTVLLSLRDLVAAADAELRGDAAEAAAATSPMWWPLYGPPDRIVTGPHMDRMQRMPALATNYRGRLLLSARVEDGGEAPGAFVAAPAVALVVEPPTTRLRLRAAIITADDLPTRAGGLGVAVCLGDVWLTFDRRPVAGGQARWLNVLDRSVDLPTELVARALRPPSATPASGAGGASLPDTFVYLFEGDHTLDMHPASIRRICYARLDTAQLLSQRGHAPVYWQPLLEDLSVNALTNDETPGSVQMRLGLAVEDAAQTAAVTAEWQAQLRLVGEPVRHSLYVHVISGRELPSADSTGTLDPYLRVNMGGSATVKSGIRYATTAPRWHEVLQLDVDVPSGPMGPVYAPPVRIELWDKDDGLFHNDDFVSELRAPLFSVVEAAGLPVPCDGVQFDDCRAGAAPARVIHAPHWFSLSRLESGVSNLVDRGTGINHGKLLLLFQLIAWPDPERRPPPAPRAVPFQITSVPRFLEVIALGCRDLDTAASARMVLDVSDRLEPGARLGNYLGALGHPAPIRTVDSVGANPSYCQRFVVPVLIPLAGPDFAPAVNLMAVCGADAVLGTASLPLAQIIEADEERRRVAVEAARALSGVAPPAGAAPAAAAAADVVDPAGIDLDDGPAGRGAGARPGPPAAVGDADGGGGGGGFAVFMRAAARRGAAAARVVAHAGAVAARAARQAGGRVLHGGAVPPGAAAAVLPEAEPAPAPAPAPRGAAPGAAGAAGRPAASIAAAPAPAAPPRVLCNNDVEIEQANPGVDLGCEALVTSDASFGVFEAKEAGFLRGRKEYRAPLEEVLHLGRTPYQSITLQAGQRVGQGALRNMLFGDTTRSVGTFKCAFRLLDRETDPPPLEFAASMRRGSGAPYVVRLYVLKGAMLQSHGVDGLCDSYLQVKLGGTTLTHRDAYIPAECDPGFYDVFELKDVCLPGPSQLRVECWDRDAYLRDELIGATSIDLEDRLFSPAWTQLGLENECMPPAGRDDGSRLAARLRTKPVEWRQLRRPGSLLSQGALSLWVDILTPTQAELYPPVDITPPPPRPYEVRLVVWKAKGLSGSMTDLYMKAWLEGQAASPQSTDVHYRAKKGKANWNWRMKWKAVLRSPRPGEALRVILQAWDKGLASHCLGEHELDLSPFVRRALRRPSQGLQVYRTDAEVMAERARHLAQIRARNAPAAAVDAAAAAAAAETRVREEAEDARKRRRLELELVRGKAASAEAAPEMARASVEAERSLIRERREREAERADAAAAAVAAAQAAPPPSPADEQAPVGLLPRVFGAARSLLCLPLTCVSRLLLQRGPHNAPATAQQAAAVAADHEAGERQPLVGGSGVTMAALGAPLAAVVSGLHSVNDARDARAAARALKKQLGIESDVHPQHAQWLKLHRSVPREVTNVPTPGPIGSLYQQDCGQVLVSIELLPEALAASFQAGFGRSEPNRYPALPPPAGRWQCSANPFYLGAELCGPGACTGFCCCLLCAAVVVLVVIGGPFIQVLATWLQLLPRDAMIAVAVVTVLLLGCVPLYCYARYVLCPRAPDTDEAYLEASASDMRDDGDRVLDELPIVMIQHDAAEDDGDAAAAAQAAQPLYNIAATAPTLAGCLDPCCGAAGP